MKEKEIKTICELFVLYVIIFFHDSNWLFLNPPSFCKSFTGFFERFRV